MKWNYLDLFSGIGGFRLGLEMAGFEFGWTGHSEIDKYANKVYHRHWPESEDLGDVRTIDVSKLPRINLITFGFPCQDLSIAGKRGGLQANRSGLFFEAMRIVRDAKPDYFVFENVKGLFSSNGGFDWLNVLREVADSGYDGQWQLLNTRWFLPQNRERIFFVGYPSGTGGRQIFPIGEGNGISESCGVQGEIENQCATAVTQNLKRGVHSGGETLIQVGTIGKDSEATRVYSPDGCARTLKDGGGMGAKTGLYEIIEDFYPDRIRTYEDCPTLRGDRTGLKVKGVAYRTRSYAGKEGAIEERDDDIANQITTIQKDSMVQLNERRIRRLTPTECARLQGFPDDHCHGLSDTQQYKCYGNSVTTLVVKAVGERILKQ